MSTLNSQLHVLAQTFARQVLETIQGASLRELSQGGGTSTGNPRRARVVPGGGGQPDPLTPPRKGKPGRLPRRSAEDIQAALDKVIALVRKNKTGMRAEQIRSTLAMQAKEMPRILKEGVAKKRLTTRGQKRATTYFAK